MGRRTGTTIHPLLIWITLIGVGTAILLPAVHAGLEHGWKAFLLGAGLGLLSLVAALGVMLLLAIAWDWLRRAGPRWPPCRTAGPECAGEYEWVRLDDGTTVMRCPCGAQYRVERDERDRLRVLERLPDGSTRPYMVHRPFRGWRPDGGSAGQPQAGGGAS